MFFKDFTKISNSVSLHFFSISRLAQIFFTMPTILVGRNKSYLSNQYSCLPKINTRLIVLNYSMARSIYPNPNSMHGWERLPCFKGKEELQYDHFLEQFTYLEKRLETQHNRSYGKVNPLMPGGNKKVTQRVFFVYSDTFLIFLILVARSFSFNVSFLPIFLLKENLHSFGGVVLFIWLSIHYHSDLGE